LSFSKSDCLDFIAMMSGPNSPNLNPLDYTYRTICAKIFGHKTSLLFRSISAIRSAVAVTHIRRFCDLRRTARFIVTADDAPHDWI